LQVITEERSLAVAEYAFEFAYLNNRQRVTAVHKANIMKKGDGMFLKVRGKGVETWCAKLWRQRVRNRQERDTNLVMICKAPPHPQGTIKPAGLQYAQLVAAKYLDT
jgi:isocitrate dehydrogenase